MCSDGSRIYTPYLWFEAHTNQRRSCTKRKVRANHAVKQRTGSFKANEPAPSAPPPPSHGVEEDAPGRKTQWGSSRMWAGWSDFVEHVVGGALRAVECAVTRATIPPLLHGKPQMLCSFLVICVWLAKPLACVARTASGLGC